MAGKISSLTWTTPPNGGSPILDYRVLVYEGSTLVSTLTPTTATTSVMASETTARTAVIQARNGLGFSAPATLTVPAATSTPTPTPTTSYTLAVTTPTDGTYQLVLDPAPTNGYVYAVYIGGSLSGTMTASPATRTYDPYIDTSTTLQVKVVRSSDSTVVGESNVVSVTRTAVPRPAPGALTAPVISASRDASGNVIVSITTAGHDYNITDLYRDGQAWRTGISLPYSDVGVDSAHSYYVRVGNGVTAQNSNTVSVPTAGAATLAVTDNGTSGFAITLSNTNGSQYSLLVNGSSVGVINSSPYVYNFDATTTATYTFVARSYFTSTTTTRYETNTVVINHTGVPAPTAPLVPPVIAGDRSGQAVTISATSAGSGYSYLYLLRDGNSVAFPVTLPFTETNTGGSHDYVVVAVSGSTSAPSNTVTVPAYTAPATQGPVAPTLAVSRNGDAVTLTAAQAGNYSFLSLYRNGSSMGAITLPYTETSVRGHEYWVYAIDAQSNAVESNHVLIGDAPLSAPTISAARTGREINITQAAPGTGVDRMDLFRDGTAYFQYISLPFNESDDDAYPSQALLAHTYSVRAYDPKGNPADSNTVSVPAYSAAPAGAIDNAVLMDRNKSYAWSTTNKTISDNERAMGIGVRFAYFKFQITATRAINLTGRPIGLGYPEGYTSQDTLMALYSAPDGNVTDATMQSKLTRIAYDDDSGGDSQPAISTTLSPGWYYVGIGAFSASVAVDSSNLAIAGLPVDATTAATQAKSVNNAVVLSTDGVYTYDTVGKLVTDNEALLLGNKNKVAWFKFQLTYDRSDTIEFSGRPAQFGYTETRPANVDPFMFLFSSTSGSVGDADLPTALTFITNNDDSGGDSEPYIALTAPKAGWYYIAIGARSANSELPPPEYLATRNLEDAAG